MTHFVDGNHIELLKNGAEYFPAVLSAIAGATHEIYLQTYIFEADTTGFQIAEALQRTAQRGVNVYVLLDGFGSKELPKKIVEMMEAHGVRVMYFRPKISPWSFKKSRLRRMHRKIIVIDRTIAFVGGINIIDDFNMPSLKHPNPGPRLDYAVKVTGVLLPAIHQSAYMLWKRTAWLHAKPMQSQQMRMTSHTTIKPAGVRAAFVLRDNFLHRRDIENAYLEGIKKAKTEIIIANAYFIPGRKFRRALIAASQRGVQVTLLLQGQMEYFFLLATRAFYEQLLKQKIKIYEYQSSYMHSKVAVIDEHWLTVGSSNIDPLSLMMAREANVFVLDKKLAQQLRADILKSIQEDSVEISQEHWKKQPMHRRLISWCVYGGVRLLAGIAGVTPK
jgi:cardiolipin synthase A/B